MAVENYVIYRVESNNKKDNYIFVVVNSIQKFEDNKINELNKILENDLYEV